MPAVRSVTRRCSPAILVSLLVLVSIVTISGCTGPQDAAIESIAVLHLVNGSGDPAQNYLADGLTEMLASELGYVSSIKVISPGSAMRYQATEKKTPEIAAELGVDAVVTGSVGQEGDKILLDIEIIDAAGVELWEGQFERGLNDMTPMRGEVVLAVAKELGVALGDREKERLSRARAVNPEAYRLVLLALHTSRGGGAEAVSAGMQYLIDAIENDPGYAPAYTALATLYILQVTAGRVEAAEGYAKAKDLALNALDLDAGSAEALAALAYVTFTDDWDWQESGRIFKEAVARNPSYVQGLLWYAQYFDAMGRFDDAIIKAQQATVLDPLSGDPLAARGISLFHMANTALAIRSLEDAIEIEPSSSRLHTEMARLQFYSGNFVVAIQSFENAYALAGWPEEMYGRLSAAFDEGSVAGYARARVELNGEILESGPFSTLDPLYGVAEPYMILDDRESALQAVRMAHVRRSSGVVTINVNPYLKHLTTDPQFVEILEQIGFEDIKISEDHDHRGHDHEALPVLGEDAN